MFYVVFCTDWVICNTGTVFCFMNNMLMGIE